MDKSWGLRHLAHDPHPEHASEGDAHKHSCLTCNCLIVKALSQDIQQFLFLTPPNRSQPWSTAVCPLLRWQLPCSLSLSYCSQKDESFKGSRNISVQVNGYVASRCKESCLNPSWNVCGYWPKCWRVPTWRTDVLTLCSSKNIFLSLKRLLQTAFLKWLPPMPLATGTITLVGLLFSYYIHLIKTYRG